jgi:hypothetical protein
MSGTCGPMNPGVSKQLFAKKVFQTHSVTKILTKIKKYMTKFWTFEKSKFAKLAISSKSILFWKIN